MDWLVWIITIAILIVLLQILYKLSRIDSRLRTIALGINQFRVRQGSIKRSFATDPIPVVDSKARTTRRDTKDIPARGARMSTAVHRRSSDESQNPDN